MDTKVKSGDDMAEMKIRLPLSLRAEIEAASAENRRKMNAEIVARLEASFRAGGGQSDRVDQAGELENLRIRVGALESRVPVDLIERLDKLDDLLGQLDGKVIVTVEKTE